ncbi:dTDP-4-dehydrorhamnose reductase [Streptomyces sp. G44]|uniref:dTDP-4-dehydrorhamnose reductase n=1 Tax=Streptomyces sp. G44 TaxID=2807632 RepID=UPI001961027A|nr:dTDP-4-dehydrorhamnose reductase [Streptomyces sp. G44]MBM7167514.1 dTDP-4-dehydrorhamnose reductase [Streptomyces sp. G44]
MREPTWLITGAKGLLGQHLQASLACEAVVALGRGALDVTDPDAGRAALAHYKPDIVINCAGWTNTEAAEEYPHQAWQVNAEGPAHLAAHCAQLGAVLVHISTDYVFAGTTSIPYPETASTAPLNAYGRSKAAGEQAVLEVLPAGYVVRTAWLYGAGRKNFVRTMIDLERVRDTVNVVNDQCGQPTWAADLADQVVRLGRSAYRGTAPAGIYHSTNSGAASWYDLACETFRLLGADPARVCPIATDELDLLAARPAYSALAHDRWRATGIAPLRPWRAALHAAFPTLLSDAVLTQLKVDV